MTLQELFNLLSDNPLIILFYFIAVPLTALLTGIFGKDQGHESPWSYVYCSLIYLASVPGIFSITLSVYFFLFERHGIMDANIYTQILPIISMIITLIIIRKNVDLEQIPGFDRITGLIIIIACLLTAMWILDRTHVWVITVMPFYVAVLFLVILLVVIRFAWTKLSK